MYLIDLISGWIGNLLVDLLVDLCLDLIDFASPKEKIWRGM